MADSIFSLLIMLAAFFVAIGLLVSIHELGHFWVARKLGIRVLKFSIGFGKPLWKHVSKVDGVEYILAAIPLGGYVKMLDEREGNVAVADAPYSYNRAPVWKRLLTLLAGPLANLLFAVLVYWVLLMVGIPGLKPVIGSVSPNSIAADAGLRRDDLIITVQGYPVATQGDVLLHLVEAVPDGQIKITVQADQGRAVQRQLLFRFEPGRSDLTEPETMMSRFGFDFWLPPMPAIVAEITAGGAADTAGLKAGDEILSVAGQPVADMAEVSKLITSFASRDVLIRIRRGQVQMELPVSVQEQVVEGKTVGRIGIRMKANYVMPDSMRALQKYPPMAALSQGFSQTWDTVALSFKMVWRMLIGHVSTKNLSGAISMVEFSGAAARQGGVVFLNWLALISISIGVFNLLPIPVLDGGQIIYQLVEWVRGEPLSEAVQLWAQKVGIAILLMLLSLTLYNDIVRHLG